MDGQEFAQNIREITAILGIVVGVVYGIIEGWKQGGVGGIIAGILLGVFVGGLLGASIANNTRYQREYVDYDTRQVKRRYNECNDRSYTNRKTRVLVGYKNFFRIKNKEYSKITKRPKDRIRITK